MKKLFDSHGLFPESISPTPLGKMVCSGLFDRMKNSKSAVVANTPESAVFLNELNKLQEKFAQAEKVDHSTLYDVCYTIAQRLYSTVGDEFKRRLFTFSKSSPISPEQYEIAKKAEKLKEELLTIHSMQEDVRRHIEATLDPLIAQAEDYEAFLFAQEYSTKTIFDKLFPMHFDFDRSVYPVLPDHSWKQKLLDLAEWIAIRKRGFTGADGSFVSLEDHGKEALLQTPTGQNLEKVRELKAQGKRVWILASHPAYAGAVMPRYVLCKTGFEDIAQGWNAIVGPRVMANNVLEAGVRSIGNLFVTLPSEETTPIKTPGLKVIYSPLVRKTKKIINGMEKGIQWKEGEQELFNQVKQEVFTVFPEGSRSILLSDGVIALKRIDPAFFRGFIQEGDFVVLMNQCGAEKMNPKGSYWLRRTEVALSVGEPIEVTKEMLEKQNAPAQALAFIEQICALPLPNGQKVIYPYQLDGSIKPEYEHYRNELV